MAEFGKGDERVLKPTDFGVTPFNTNKVYPTPPGPDQYGQVNTSDKDSQGKKLCHRFHFSHLFVIK